MQKITRLHKPLIIISTVILLLVTFFVWKKEANSIHLYDNPKMFLKEVQKHVHKGTSGSKALEIMQNNGFSCTKSSDSYGTFITCKGAKWPILNYYFGGKEWMVTIQLRQKKVYKVSTTIYLDL